MIGVVPDSATGGAMRSADTSEPAWKGPRTGMDTFTHGFSGYLIGRAGLEQRAGRAATAAAVLGSLLPDADHVMEWVDTGLYLREHRGWSHSLVAMIAWAGLSACLFARRGPPRTRGLVALAGALGFAGHIFLDDITAFGTMWLMPFSRHRFALDWVFIVDPAFTGILLLGMLGTWLRPRHQSRWAAGALAVLAGYIALCAALHARALGILEAAAHARFGAEVRTCAALPLLPHAFHWRGLVATATTIHEARIAADGELTWAPESEPAAAPLLAQAPHTPELAALAGMARFLTVHRSDSASGARWVFHDHQFSVVPGRRVYEVTIETGPDGTVLASRFNDNEATGRTLLFLLLIALVAAALRRWLREAPMIACAEAVGP